MNILIDARLYGLENAGLGRYVNNLVKKISESDKKNDYVILLRKKYFDSLILPPNWKKVAVNFRHYSFSEQFLLPGLINNEKPDVVHFPHFNIPVLYSGKFVVTIHDLLMHQQKGLEATTLPAPVYYLKRLMYRFVFDMAIKKSATIIVPSNAVKNDLIKFYKNISDKISVTYEGLDNIHADTNKPLVRFPYFIYTGNAYPHKNIKRMVQAIKLLNQHDGQKTLLLIASARNVFTKRVEKLVQELKAGEYVQMLGFVPDDKITSLYKNSLGFVFASLSEGFGLPGLEAMQAGTILLASQISVFKEIYQNHAIYFNQLDFSSIEKEMRNVIDMPKSERLKRIKEGQDFVKRYSWDKMAEQTIEIYKSI